MNRRMSLFLFIRSLFRLLRRKPVIPDSLADNQLLQTILNRRSVRNFRGEPVPEDVFQAILEAGRVAPSTVNLQTWSLAVFNAEQWREQFGHIIPFRADRAVIIMADIFRQRQILTMFPRSPLVDHTAAVMNASLATMNMNIAAEALGVSSVMLSETGRSGILDAAYLKEKLDLPDGVIPLMTIVFGYAKGLIPPMPPRLPMNEIIFTESYRPSSPRVLQEWYDQMEAGYKAMRPNSSFSRQIEVYCQKLGRAEEDLRRMIIG